MTATQLHITGDERADALLARDANALLIGMVLDQQVTMEKAFAGPAVIAERWVAGSRAGHRRCRPGTLRCDLRPAAGDPPFPRCDGQTGSGDLPSAGPDLRGRCCEHLVRGPIGRELRDRIAALPGFGAQKAAIFTALLGKQYGVQPQGWRAAAGSYGESGSHRSVADVVDQDSLEKVRATKKAAKAAAKAAMTAG